MLSVLVPFSSWAQGGEQPGIDLTRPDTAPAQPAPATPLPPPPPGTKPVERKPAVASPAPASEAAPLAPGEGDVAFNDRVKAVQRKGFLKAHRLEVGVMVPASINDAFFEKVGASGKLAYHFEDSFALAVKGTHFTQVRSSHGREGRQAFESQLLNSQLSNTLMLDGIWSPVYGKIAWLGEKIVHFDLYLSAGFGGAWSATSEAPRNNGPHVATELGAGIRFYPADWLALEGGVNGIFYPDQPNISVPSTLQKVITAQVGVAVFFPFRFGYVYP